MIWGLGIRVKGSGIGLFGITVISPRVLRFTGTPPKVGKSIDLESTRSFKKSLFDSFSGSGLSINQELKKFHRENIPGSQTNVRFGLFTVAPSHMGTGRSRSGNPSLGFRVCGIYGLGFRACTLKGPQNLSKGQKVHIGGPYI